MAGFFPGPSQNIPLPVPVVDGGTGVTTSTGSGSVVLNTSPTLVTPALGTPASGVLTHATGLPLTTGVTGTLPVGNGGTGNTTGQPTIQTATATLSVDTPLATGTWTSLLVVNAPSAGYYEITGNLEIYNSNALTQTAEFILGPTANSSTGAYIMGFFYLATGEQDTKQITAFATLTAGQAVYLEAIPSSTGLTCQAAPSGVPVTQLKIKRLY